MTIDFKVKDIIHKITVKFVHSFLPNAKKAYNLKAVLQPELDIHGVASKAVVYNVATSPKVIEEGLNAGMELIYYLVADGYRIKTPLFNLRMRIPGEYNGTETSLPEGIFPVARLQASMAFREYLKEKVKVKFDGVDRHHSFIAEVIDEATGLVDDVMTVGNILTIRGSGIKIVSDEAHKDQVGVFFKNSSGKTTRARIIAVNEPMTLKVLVPTELCSGALYRIEVTTQGSGNNCAHMLKELRSIRSELMLPAA